MLKPNEFYWLRLGDAFDYEPFRDLVEVAEALLPYVADIDDTDPIEAGPCVGFEDRSRMDDPYVSLFVGDGEADLIRPLDREEWADLKRAFRAFDRKERLLCEEHP